MGTDELKYLKLANWIKEQILSGKKKQGDKLQSENELSELFGYSRQTVRQSIALLANENYVERRRGSGTYVIFEPQKIKERTMTIGVISTYVDNYIFPSIIRGIENVLSKHNYSMQLIFTHNKIENEIKVLKSLVDKKVDGIIVEPTKSGIPNPNIPLYREILSGDIPIVFFNAYYPNVAIPHVSLDDAQAGKAATRYLINMGHKNITGFFKSDDLQGHLRYSGYLDALIEAGITVNAKRILWYATEDVKELFSDRKRILGRLKDSTAVLSYNDEITESFLSFLNKENIKVPDDLSVISIDNSNAAEYFDPPLTTINHPKELLGKIVAQNLINRIKDPSFDMTYEFEPQIIERRSVIKNKESN